MTRGNATANKVRRMLKGSRLPLKQKERIITTYCHGAMRFSAKTWHPRTWEYKRMQAAPNGLLRRACGVNLQKMKALGLNHAELRRRCGVPLLRAEFQRDQLLWLGHVLRMCFPLHAGTMSNHRNYPRYFQNGTIEVGDLQRPRPGEAGFVIHAGHKTLIDMWDTVLRDYGQTSLQLVEVFARRNNGQAWLEFIDQGYDRAVDKDWEEGRSRFSQGPSTDAASPGVRRSVFSPTRFKELPRPLRPALLSGLIQGRKSGPLPRRLARKHWRGRGSRMLPAMMRRRGLRAGLGLFVLRRGRAIRTLGRRGRRSLRRPNLCLKPALRARRMR